MKSAKWLLTIICTLLVGLVLGLNTFAKYKLEKDYFQEWHLSDKSSTISAKSEHIDNFVSSLEQGYAKGDFAKNDAIFLKTPNNDFEKNLVALKTLSQRLDELQDMDPNSFQYNTAIQQITQQEQGEAQAMVNTFANCYYLANFPILWGWIGGTLVGFIVIGYIVAFILWLIDL